MGISLDWGHHPQPPDWREWLQQPLLKRCAHHWLYINGPGYAQVEHIAKLVHFEEIIRDPLRFAIMVSQEVGLDPGEHQSELKAWAERVQDSNNERFIEAQTSQAYSRPDHTVRVGRWRENLTPTEVAQLRPMVAETAARFGYRLDEEESV